MVLSPKIVRNLLNPKVPSYMVFFITNKCNASCFHCFYWGQIEDGKTDYLSLEEIEKMAEKIGIMPYLLLSGGEPFLRKDISGICHAFIQKASTRFITIPTNAILSKPIAEFTEEMVSTYPDLSLRIQLSLDGVGENHDLFRGHKGNFEKLMKTHDLLVGIRDKYPNLSLGVVSILCRRNYPWLEELIDHVNTKMSVNQHHIGYLRSQGRGGGAESVSLEEFQQAIDLLHSKGVKKDHRPLWTLLRAANYSNSRILAETLEKDKMILPCKAVNKFIVVNEVGVVYPCEILDKPLGNLREFEYSLPALLKSDNSLEIKKWIQKTHCYCTWECAIHNNVIFSPGYYPRLLGQWLKIVTGNSNQKK